MSEQVSVSQIKETQNALSKYVKKVPLSEKLLKKPPFRYLHDIVTTKDIMWLKCNETNSITFYFCLDVGKDGKVITETGFLDGIFTVDELNSNNVKDKESKIAFLNKLISAVKKSTGKNITVRAAKIVAGLEVNKTLELLQAIGNAIDEKVNATKNVTQPTELKNIESQETLNSDRKEREIKDNVKHDERKENKKVPEKVNTTRRSNNKQSVQTEDTSNQKNSTEKLDKPKKEVKIKKIPEPIGKPTKKTAIVEASSTVPTKALVKRNSISSKSTPVRRPSLKDNKQNSVNSKPLSELIKEEKEEGTDASEKKKEVIEKDDKSERKHLEQIVESKPKREQDNGVSSKVKENEETPGNMNKKHDGNLPKDEQKHEKTLEDRHDSVIPRPGSARPGLRKLAVQQDNKQNDTVPKETSGVNGNDQKNQRPPSVRPRTANRPASARPGAPKIRDRGEVAAVEEPPVVAAPVNVIEEGKQDHFMDDTDSFIVIETEKAPLLSDDLVGVDETKQGQLVHQILKTQKELNESIAGDKNQNKQPQIEWEAGRQAEKNLVSEEIEKIRNSIQILTSAANPLGKLFDFLQEDVDEMQRELQHWKNMNEKLRKQQQSELELGKTLLQPLQKQLSDVENSIEEEYLQIANIKITVLNNDEKILKLATNNGTKIRIK